ncbi:acyl-CoA reductase [Pendulispora albinea]|uniref:Acyl-CoA reductase n=1 Tax=Pendulispora albinea TaxID=2741071 RepID=A0ABZ2LRH1_9BACT
MSKASQSMPFIVCGRRRAPTEEASQEIRLVTGQSVLVPIITEDVTAAILAQDRMLLRDVPSYEIFAFLKNVGRNWKSREYARRRVYVRQLVAGLGYSDEMANHEADWIAMWLSSHVYLYDLIRAELGDRHILDRWVAGEEADVRAFPRGRTLHVLAGNVPLAGIGSILRALITKNVCVVKSSSTDPFTPVALALSFLDVDPAHPVARAMSVVHWPGGHDGALERALVADADALCAWGGPETMKWALRHVGPEAEILRFGPRRSVAVVGAGTNLEATARALAHDVCMYDQRACFSVQQVFTEEPTAAIIPHLRAAFGTYQRMLPRGYHDFDERAHASLSVLEADFSGAEVYTADDHDWSIVVCPPAKISGHPLGRTLFVHPIASIEDVTPFIDGAVQTVALAPWARAAEVRDAYIGAGASRIVDVGMNNLFRQGGAHDGFYPLQRLVRFGSVELPGSVHPKSVTMRVDQTELLEQNKFSDLIP